MQGRPSQAFETDDVVIQPLRNKFTCLNLVSAWSALSNSTHLNYMTTRSENKIDRLPDLE
jgi:hypothetical protein